MLRRLHNHIFAVKLRDVFTQSPLVLVYQTLGHVDHSGVKQQLQASVAKDLPASHIQVDLCQMKNTMAAAAGDDTLTRLFNNSNLLVGFKFPEYMQQQSPLQPSLQQQQDLQQQQQAARQLGRSKISKGVSPTQIVGGLLEQPMAGPHLPQPALKALVEMGVKLPSQQPVVLVGAFYKRGSTPLAYLKKWIKLDAGQVYGELLGTLESPIEGMLAFEGTAEDLLDACDAAAGSDLACVLDYKAQSADAAAPAEDQRL